MAAQRRISLKPERLNYLHDEALLEVEINESVFCKMPFFPRLIFRVKQSGQLEAHENSCKPCPVTASSPVCGSDGHNYASEVKEAILHRLHSLKALTRIIFLLLSIKKKTTSKRKMESARVIVLNNESSPVKCCFLLCWHIRGRSRATRFITARGRASAPGSTWPCD